LSTFFASPAVKIHQIKKHVLFNSRPLGKNVGHLIDNFPTRFKNHSRLVISNSSPHQ
jgi:hypothetical protein